jgi:hypothetical protein
MARVFTIEFEFSNQLQRAIVVIRNSDSQLKVYIKFLDREAIEVLGNDSIEFDGLTGYRNSDRERNHPLQQLLFEIVNKVIVEHLLK